MDAFTQHTGTGVPLRRSNVDTDQIIPAVYLKRVTRTGFEDGLFAAWRNDPEFVAQPARVRRRDRARRRPRLRHRLLARARRLGAQDYGFKVVISSRFADIFRGNSGKAGLLAAQVEPGRRRAAVEADRARPDHADRGRPREPDRSRPTR